MRDALSLLTSSTVLPPLTGLPSHHRHRHRHSTSSPTTTKPAPKPNPRHKPQISTSPLLSSSRLDNRQCLTYYTELASKLAEDGRFEDFLMISDGLVASGVEPSELLALLNAQKVSSGIARVLGEGKLNGVLEMLFNGVRKLGIQPVQLFDGVALESLKAECSRLLKSGEVQQLVSLMEMLAGFQFIIKELVEPSDVINLCIKKRDPTAAIRYAQNLSHGEMLFCSIILEFGKKRDLPSALVAFEASKQYLSSPNMHAYRTIIDVCGLCGDYLKARAIYEELLAANITPNTYVVNSLMNVNSHDLSYTLEIYKKMEKLGVTADITSHNILLKSCRLAAKVELARDIYGEIRKLELSGALKLDVFTYSTMIKVFADAKMWKRALEIKEDMVSSGVIPNTVTWSSLISACANAGLVEQSMKLFNEMLQAGCEPNSQCFNVLLHACVEACQFDRAFRLFQCWKETGFQQSAADDKLNNLDKFVAKDQMRVPIRSYSHLTVRIPFKPTTSTYNILMKACGNDYLRAKALMDEMTTFGLTPNHISWSILIDICGSSGNVSRAIQILRSMREAGIQPDVITYTTAIKICVEHKNPKLAFTLFAEMKKYQIKPNLVTYNTILRARSRYGSLQEVQQSLAVYQHMRKAGYKPNDHYLKQLIEEWCEGVIQNGHRKKAQFASRITDFGPQSLLLEKVAEHLQDSNAESLSIDLRGLSKVEARIVVLAVLRKFKEKYIAGNSIKDDMLIVLGLQKLGDNVSKDDTGVRDAVIRLLQQDLGLQVFEAGPRIGNDTRRDQGSPTSSNLKLEELERSSLPHAPQSPTRRPLVLQRLKVTRESLHRWLHRKMGASTPSPVL
ncbi:Pentatricopeptide repeat-containing protein, chloroplastic [Sesamum alatum]|uniref:Pentatricopeptide repeat-containing protein, chloroplastic n=1 Tax=Sesamum alatum TaxID=300844 RepID=A0AAE1XW34_9LAMI|nr:Pentatricopeptide repeat-containing protein, chloroplastic [Sesamum alatum]